MTIGTDSDLEKLRKIGAIVADTFYLTTCSNSS